MPEHIGRIAQDASRSVGREASGKQPKTVWSAKASRADDGRNFSISVPVGHAEHNPSRPHLLAAKDGLYLVCGACRASTGNCSKLGIKISQATVGRWMPWRPKVPSPTWRSFLRNHLPEIAAIDMFVVATRRFGSSTP